MRRETTLGFSYVRGSLRATSTAGDEYAVTEIDPVNGSFAVELPDGFEGSASIAFQRELLRGGDLRPDQVIGTADACIYCGKRKDLQDEHVIPYGLEGDYVLRQASCSDCGAMTSRFELAVLRHLLLPARTSLEIRTRRPRERPDRLPLLEMEDGERRTRDVAVEDHPTYMALPVLLPPAGLRGADKPNLEVTGAWLALVGRTSLAEASRQRGGTAVGVQLSVDAYAFARMIGKIGFGFAVAADLGSVATDLPACLRADDESIGWLVGGAPDISLPETGLHAADVSVVDGIVHVRVRLFAQLGAPEYLVLAGRLFDPGPDDARSVSIEAQPAQAER
jgi:hypothetical protein